MRAQGQGPGHGIKGAEGGREEAHAAVDGSRHSREREVRIHGQERAEGSDEEVRIIFLSKRKINQRKKEEFNQKKKKSLIRKKH